MSDRDLGRMAWALLDFIHRHANGGPPPPDITSAAFDEAYEELIHFGLIEPPPERVGWTLTGEGARRLRAYYAGE